MTSCADCISTSQRRQSILTTPILQLIGSRMTAFPYSDHLPTSNTMMVHHVAFFPSIHPFSPFRPFPSLFTTYTHILPISPYISILLLFITVPMIYFSSIFDQY